jgi:putative hydroxymethylpyrimidine transport system substrate-binding protein
VAGEVRRLALSALAVLALAGCGTRHEAAAPARTAPLRVALLAPNAAQAPIYAAAAGGHFGAAGLSVTTRATASPVQALADLAAGRADLAVSTEPAVLEARERRLRVVSVATLVTGPLSAAIWLPDAGVRSARDLAAKPTGTPGLDYQQAFLRTLAGKPVTPVDVGARTVTALEHRRVAAVVGAFSNQEGVELAPRKPSVTPVTRGGVPAFYEFVLVARQQDLPREGDAVRSFLGALVRGTRDLRRRSPAAVAAFRSAERGVAARAADTMLARTLPLLAPPAPQPYGYQSDWTAFAAWMRQSALLRGAVDPRQAYTNRYLPGEGL